MTVLNYKLPKYEEEAQLETPIKTRMSMQQVVSQALAARAPQNPNTPPQQMLATQGGFSGTAQ